MEEFDSDETTVSIKGSHYLYTLGQKTLLIDKKMGMIKEYKKGEHIILRFRKQTLFEGLYLPSDINVILPKENMSAEIKIKNFILNEGIKENIFAPIKSDKNTVDKKKK